MSNFSFGTEESTLGLDRILLRTTEKNGMDGSKEVYKNHQLILEDEILLQKVNKPYKSMT